MKTAEEIREVHEAFVTGHKGSSPQDIILAIYPAIPASVAVVVIGQGRSGWVWLLIESIFLVVPLTLSFTYLANYALEMSAAMMAIAGLAVFLTPSKISTGDTSNGKRLGYLTSVRGLLNLVTVIGILAVDFRSFPRRFVKTEEYGYSLMDAGAAAFIISNGVVEGRKRPSYKVVVRDGIILTALGILRLALVRATDYQHHVTEYGLHANFFFTLAFVKITCSWWVWRLNCISSLLLAVFISIGHHFHLVSGNGAAWTLSDLPRDTLITANREWIVSMPGYIAIYLLGTAIGNYIFNKSAYRFGKNLSSSLFVLSVVSAGILVGLHLYLDLPSRRLANPTFVCFCGCFLMIVLTNYTLIEEALAGVFPRLSPVPHLFQAINQYPLLFFLVANVATGLVNKSMNTLDIAYPFDLLIINAYSMGLTSLMLYLNSRRLKLKIL